MWGSIVTLLLLGGLAGYAVRESHRRLQVWKDAAASCGLQDIEASGLWIPRLQARAGPMGVRLEASGDKGQHIRAVVVAPGLLDFKSVRVRPELFLPWMREIEIGDESFDETFLIEGPARMVLALLDAETRRLLLSLSTKARLEVYFGELRAEGRDESVLPLLPRLLQIGQRFAQSMDVPRRLAKNVKHDPQAGVRLQSLLLLIREYPEEPATAKALRKACSDRSPEVRLRAAKELGAEGHRILLKVAEDLKNDAVSAEAVSILDRELPFERARAILDEARGLRRIQTARACLEVLGRSGAAAAGDVLAKVMAIEKGELATVAAQALGATGSPSAEPSLILALQREEKDLRVAAANALGRVGSVAAVLPLKGAAESSWLDLDLRRATRQAIAEIQSRLQGASPGQLSLAGAEAGQLSLAEAEAGQLSLIDQAGQLSLSGDEDKPGEA